MAVPSLIVISDLHMGAGPVDDFEPEIEKHLVSFLAHWATAGEATELVINGDLLDFVQAPPYKGPELRSQTEDKIPLCFTEEQSAEKLRAIYNSHQPSFAALGEFLAARASNRIVLMPGNHDADFFWRTIQDQFTALVCARQPSSADRLIYHLNPVYRPARFPEVWIEHGQQYDQVNCFTILGDPYWSQARPPIFKDRRGTERLYECIGTRFLIKYLNDLDANYPYVDNVKPFWRFLQLFGTSAPKAPLKAVVALSQMLLYLGRTLITKPKDLMGLEIGQSPSAAKPVLDAYNSAAPSRKQRFVQAILERGFALSANPDILLSSDASAASLMEFLSENLDILDLIDTHQDNTLSLLKSFAANETDDLRQEALKIANLPHNCVNTVIMGHTHEVVRSDKYINTGSWTRYYKLAKGEHFHTWDVLKKSGWKQFPYELNFVLVQPGSSATLENFHREGVETNA